MPTRVIVDAYRGSAVALAQAGDIGDGDVAVAHGAEPARQFSPQLVGAAKMTRHIGAHLTRHARRRRQMKVRKEISDAVDVRQRNLRTARKSLQLVDWQITVLALNLPQVVEEQT